MIFQRFLKFLARSTLCAAALALTTTHGSAQSRSSGDAALGQQTFSTCAACHGLDGRGGEHAPNIVTDAKVKRLSDNAILRIIRDGIPAAGMPGFSKSLSDNQIQAVFKYLRELQNGTSSGGLKGNTTKGRELFYGRAGCSECHTIDNRGGFLGADLSGYGGNHTPAEIRAAIIDPNSNLEARRATVTVLTRSGKTYRGVIRNEDNFSLQMQTSDGAFHLFDKSELTRIEHQASSLMPTDYRSKLTDSELNDLISFLSQTAGSNRGDSDDDQE
jgi:cytochrome c oxidase cbb3-type subunit 3